MKKLRVLLILLMGLTSVINYAQDKKMFAGLNLGFSSNDNASSFNIGPRLGFWLNDNMALVGGVNFKSDKNKAVNPEETTTTFGIGAQLRYGWHVGDKTFFYLAPGVSYSSTKHEISGSSATVSRFVVELTPGINYMISDSWSINTELGLLNFTSITPEGGTSDSQFSVRTQMSAISFGLWYHF